MFVKVLILVTMVFFAVVEGVPAPSPRQMRTTFMSLNCAGSPLNISTQVLSSLKRCARQFVSVQKDPDGRRTVMTISRDQHSCFFVCVGLDLGLMNSTGIIDREKVKDFIMEMIPTPSFKTMEILSAVNTCADEFAEGSFDMMNGNCSDYKEFMACTAENIFKACDYIPSDFEHSEEESAE